MSNDKLKYIAIELGYQNPQEMLTEMLKIHKTGVRISEIIGVTSTCVNCNLKKYGLANSFVEKRSRIRNEMEKHNKEHGTHFKKTKEFLACLYKKHGSKQASEMTGGTDQSYIRLCAVDIDRENGGIGKSSVIKLKDERGPTVPGPWTNPNRSPCKGVEKPCRFLHRDKNEPGCEGCRRMVEYWLLQQPATGVHGTSFDITENHSLGYL